MIKNHKEIYDEFIKTSGYDLSDFNDEQISAMCSLAYEEGHSGGIWECANEMYSIVDICRDVIKLQDEKTKSIK